MIFRVATLNLEQDQKRWEARRNLVVAQFAKLRPDIWALNEIHIPSQTGRWLQHAAAQASGTRYALVQQSKAGEDGRAQAEGLLTRYPAVESANLDYHSHDCVALVVRLEIDGRLLDVYVTHLIAAKVADSARQHQAALLLDWMRTRADAVGAVVCGDFNAAPDQPSIRIDGRGFARDAKPTDRLHAAARARWRAHPSGVAALRSLHRLHLGIRVDQSSRHRFVLQRAGRGRS